MFIREALSSALQRKLRYWPNSCQSFLIDETKEFIDVDAVEKILSYLDSERHVSNRIRTAL